MADESTDHVPDPHATGDKERRTHQRTTETAVHRMAKEAMGPAVDAVSEKIDGLSQRVNNWKEITAFMMILIIVYTLGNAFIKQFQSTTEQAVQDRRDAADLLRLQQASENKRIESLVQEFRSMGSKSDAIVTSNSAVQSEIRASRISMERTEKELTKALAEMTKVIASKFPPEKKP